MKNEHNPLGALLGLAASFYWLGGVIYLPTLLANYDPVSQTISELSIISTPLANRINFGWSLPLGLLQCWAVFTECRQRHITVEVRKGLAAFGSVGIAYVACSFFPCDPGAPLWGSWRQMVHNAFGGLEYAGGGLGLLLFGIARRDNYRLAMAIQLSGLLVWTGLLLMTVQELFGVRGAVQRFSEALLFGWLAWGSIKRLTSG
ncbi:DUF998 domain-containing protein [Methylomonas sp. 11b]|uniref:DUF998 domain-containing protein n=1 Tax=Methylomonas sp. 11b TaxID=1168169 RepID=UPI00047C6607|nr:DUF998 domain-containing protein [Methylomonas sp. 11b]